eukprot:2447101-Amphidinium_carterae.1
MSEFWVDRREEWSILSTTQRLSESADTWSTLVPEYHCSNKLPHVVECRTVEGFKTTCWSCPSVAQILEAQTIASSRACAADLCSEGKTCEKSRLGQTLKSQISKS